LLDVYRSRAGIWKFSQKPLKTKREKIAVNKKRQNNVIGFAIILYLCVRGRSSGDKRKKCCSKWIMRKRFLIPL
jgi:hypothetical protein